MNRWESRFLILLVVITLIFLSVASSVFSQEIGSNRQQSDNGILNSLDSFESDNVANVSWKVFLPVIFADYPQPACVPTLQIPAEGATMDNGRSDGLDKIVWDFDWSNCPGATEYHLFVKLDSASNPAIDETAIAGSSFHHESPGYVGPANLATWRWKVRAKVSGSWGPWSSIRSFAVEPPDTDPPLACMPTLLTPAEGATMDNGRTDGLNPLIWNFDWSNCPGATDYHLYVKLDSAPNPAIDEAALPGSSFHYAPIGYVGSGSLATWRWKVRAKVGGSWGPWSPKRTFVVEPPNTDPPLACVPTLLAPAAGATMDNGRTDGLDPLIWDFDWSNCPGATQYHLYVKLASVVTPVIDDNAIPGSSYHHQENFGYVPNGNLMNWQWKVRAKVGGNWKPWSPVRTFNVEPPNTDPP